MKLICTFVFSLFFTSHVFGAVDLHAHLFMEDGTPSWLFDGQFNGPMKSTGWTDKFASRVNAQSLDRSENRIVVVAIYTHPLANGDMRDNVRSQIKKAQAFVAQYPNWIIARSSAEATAALKKGKRVLVLSIEGAADILETEEDLREFVDEGGVRIVTLLHFKDDLFGGAAFMPGYYVLLNPWAYIKSIFSATPADGVRLNSQGLTDTGKEFVVKLIERKVWIDLSHSSDASQKIIVPILKEKGIPLLYTHTIIREFSKSERAITADQLADVKATGGIVGILPSTRILSGTVLNSDTCGTMCSPPCSVGMASFARQFRLTRDAIGAENVFVGSDINAPMDGLESGCPEGSSLAQEGYWRHDQVPALYLSVGMNNPQRVVENFLKAWARADAAF